MSLTKTITTYNNNNNTIDIYDKTNIISSSLEKILSHNFGLVRYKPTNIP